MGAGIGDLGLVGGVLQSLVGVDAASLDEHLGDLSVLDDIEAAAADEAKARQVEVANLVDSDNAPEPGDDTDGAA